MTNYINTPVIACLAYCFAYGCTNGPSDGDKSTKQKSETLVSNSMEYNSCQTSDDYKQHTINMYSLAIRDYIKLVKDEYNFTFDTLYLGRHSHGSPTDFPDIELPATIDGTAIFIISTAEGEKIQTTNKSAFYINLFGSVDTGLSKFFFVAFSRGFKHQFDCTIQYRCDTHRNEYVIDGKTFQNYGYSKH